MAYRHILAAVDLSEESSQVLDRARAEADQHGARLSLLSVVKPLTQVYGGIDIAPLGGTNVSFEQQALDQAGQQLAELARRYGVAASDAHVLLGAPAYDIREFARTAGADLIVIGTHGRHGLGLLLGSTANGVLHGVDRDVLVVRVRFEK
ncbi:MAG: universal stress protein [Pseudomonadales bacterium]